MTSVAFLTLSNPSGYCIYDQLAVPAFGELGFSVAEIPWDSPNHDWSQYSAVILRSTWDYTERLSDFMEALHGIDAQSTLLNPLSIVRWNQNKAYLGELASAGVPSIPTRFGSALTTAKLKDAFDAFAADEVVVKPTVSANARGTFRLRSTDDWENALRFHKEGDYLLQPFVSGVVDQGETSLFYFGGRYSHAVTKTPKPGDFRVQEEHGGRLQLSAYDEAADAIAQQALAAVPSSAPLLYARVDLVPLGGSWALIELELIEPSLYFNLAPDASMRFAEALRACESTRNE